MIVCPVQTLNRLISIAPLRMNLALLINCVFLLILDEVQTTLRLCSAAESVQKN